MRILQIISVIAAFLLGIIVVTRNRADRNRWMLLLFNASVGFWIVSYILADLPTDASLIWNKIVFISALFMGYSGYLLVASMANRLGRSAVLIGMLLVAWSALVLFTPLIVQDIVPRYSAEQALEGFNIIRGEGYFLYVVSLLLTGCGLVGYIFSLARKAKGRFKSQLRVIFVGFAGLLAVGVLLGVVLPNLLGTSVPANYAFLSSFIIMGAFTYAIVQQHLFDIRWAIIRSLGYLLALSVIAVFYGLAIFGLADIFLYNASETVLRLYYGTAALFVVITFQPLKRLFSRLTRQLFFRDTYETQQVLDELGSLLVRQVEVVQLVKRSLQILDKALKPSGLELILLRDHKRVRDIALDTSFKHTDELIQAILQKHHTGMMVTDDLINHRADARLHGQLVDAGVAIAMPLVTSNATVGYLLVGYKESGDAFSRQDVNLVRIFADQLAVAVQNALRFEEISHFNLTLKDEIADATSQLRESNKKLHKLDEAKDEFISMASHQLRTPLTSVKGYLSMVLEGDAGRITADQRKLLEEAYNSSQRMVYLIGDFLNISRLQTGGFMLESEPVNLADMVAEEVEQLKTTAGRRSIKLEYSKPEQFPEISLDNSKMRQVIMNFIDNAIFYSRPNSAVVIQLTHNAKEAVLAVHDTGIGVPTAERHHLFTKFFRATNARKVRPDGTGIGLYMARKVITAHGGSIIFETKEGKGSTFGFRLPLKNQVK